MRARPVLYRRIQVCLLRVEFIQDISKFQCLKFVGSLSLRMALSNCNQICLFNKEWSLILPCVFLCPPYASTDFREIWLVVVYFRRPLQLMRFKSPSQPNTVFRKVLFLDNRKISYICQGVESVDCKTTWRPIRMWLLIFSLPLVGNN
jgi:hypothetical protein